jgi:pilus assembly protein Flp/PilA
VRQRPETQPTCHLGGGQLGRVVEVRSRKGRILMKNWALKIRAFLVAEDGPTAVEYAVMLALIVIVCLTAITSVGTNAKTTFNNIANSLAS